MADVLSRRRWGSRWSWAGLLGGLAGLLLLGDPTPALGQAADPKSPPAGKTAKAKDAPPDDDDKDEPPAAPGTPPADPSQSRRVAPVEVFKDPLAEDVLDLKKLSTMAPAPFTDADRLTVYEMAQNPNLPIKRTLIDQVVRGLTARLTDRKSVESLLEEPEDPPKGDVPKKGAPVKKKDGDGGKGIQMATTYLLEPIFIARGVKNDAFLAAYRRSLLQFLPPLLKNHLVPRVQAMIVLGQAADPTPEGVQLFQKEIANPSQVLWVKLWALEGVTNIKKEGGRFTVDIESKVARSIAQFLNDQKDLPWPIQMRALEAMGWLRQSGLPAEAAKAYMANSAMRFLADTDAKFEVRAEAARALGLMQVNAVPKYNFRLVAHYAGLLAADLAAEINEQFSDTPPRAENPTRARYMTALLVGPVYQAFDGVQGESNSGILQSGKADTESLKQTQKIFAMVRPLAQASVELLGAPTKEFKGRKEKLAGRIAELRAYLKQNPPPSRKLTDPGREYGTEGEQARADRPAPAPAPALAGIARGR